MIDDDDAYEDKTMNYLFVWIKLLRFKAEALNFIEILSSIKWKHIVNAYTNDRHISRI